MGMTSEENVTWQDQTQCGSEFVFDSGFNMLLSHDFEWA